MKKIILLLLLLVGVSELEAQNPLDYKPKVLVVTAHPDDDALFSATIFKTTQLLNGVVDLAVMTNGEGGYRYSTLGNYIYGRELDDETIGRDYLPAIRKKELMAGGDIVGIRNYFFFDQQDFYYTQDIEETLEKWNKDIIINRLSAIIERENYDFMLLMLPTESTHGHHKASAVIALNALDQIQESVHPISFVSYIRRGEDDPGEQYTQLNGYPETEAMEGAIFEFNRNQTFGYEDRLNYNIIANWVIAEHKSQGTMQLLTQNNTGIIEQYWYLKINGEDGLEKASAYFKAVNLVQPD